MKLLLPRGPGNRALVCRFSTQFQKSPHPTAKLQSLRDWPDRRINNNCSNSGGSSSANGFNGMAQIITLSSLTFVKPKELSDQILDPEKSSKVAVVDVRDSDYIGGHVKGCIHAPIDQFDARMPELLRVLQDKDRVVFHCMLSQQRGPKAALAYARAKAAAESKKLSDPNAAGLVETVNGTTKIAGQQICVLEGGFTNWERNYGPDKKLTEGYVRELWDAEVFGKPDGSASSWS